MTMMMTETAIPRRSSAGGTISGGSDGRVPASLQSMRKEAQVKRNANKYKGFGDSEIKLPSSATEGDKKEGSPSTSSGDSKKDAMLSLRKSANVGGAINADMVSAFCTPKRVKPSVGIGGVQSEHRNSARNILSTPARVRRTSLTGAVTSTPSKSGSAAVPAMRRVNSAGLLMAKEYMGCTEDEAKSQAALNRRRYADDERRSSRRSSNESSTSASASAASPAFVKRISDVGTRRQRKISPLPEKQTRRPTSNTNFLNETSLDDVSGKKSRGAPSFGDLLDTDKEKGKGERLSKKSDKLKDELSLEASSTHSTSSTLLRRRESRRRAAVDTRRRSSSAHHSSQRTPKRPDRKFLLGKRANDSDDDCDMDNTFYQSNESNSLMLDVSIDSHDHCEYSAGRRRRGGTKLEHATKQGLKKKAEDSKDGSSHENYTKAGKWQLSPVRRKEKANKGEIKREESSAEDSNSGKPQSPTKRKSKEERKTSPRRLVVPSSSKASNRKSSSPTSTKPSSTTHDDGFGTEREEETHIVTGEDKSVTKSKKQRAKKEALGKDTKSTTTEKEHSNHSNSSSSSSSNESFSSSSSSSNGDDDSFAGDDEPPKNVTTTLPSPTMWTCVCGEENGMECNFCGICATKRTWECESCHFSYNKCGFKFCGKCGKDKSNEEWECGSCRAIMPDKFDFCGLCGTGKDQKEKFANNALDRKRNKIGNPTRTAEEPDIANDTDFRSSKTEKDSDFLPSFIICTPQEEERQ